MPTFELSISPSYVNTWGFVEGVRELYQNALDQQVVDCENLMFQELKNTGNGYWTLTIGSKNSVLDRKTLLLGESSKKGDDKTIGQFGEGYKLALLVLVRSGLIVEIFNYGAKEKWTPRIALSSKYKTDVLMVDVKKYIFKSVPDHNLTFVISGIPNASIEELWKYNLNTLSYENIPKIETRIGDVLLDEDLKGKIFVSGLFVSKLENDKVLHGYNFKPGTLTLDRDRRMATEFDVFWATSKMWSAVEGHADLIQKMIAEGRPEVQHCTYHTPKRTVVDAVVELFKEEYGSRAYPVTSQKEYDRVKEASPRTKPIFVNETHASVLRRHIEEPTTVTKSKKTRDLSPRKHLENVLKKIEKSLTDAGKKTFRELLVMSNDWRWK